MGNGLTGKCGDLYIYIHIWHLPRVGFMDEEGVRSKSAFAFVPHVGGGKSYAIE